MRVSAAGCPIRLDHTAGPSTGTAKIEYTAALAPGKLPQTLTPPPASSPPAPAWRGIPPLWYHFG